MADNSNITEPLKQSAKTWMFLILGLSLLGALAGITTAFLSEAPKGNVLIVSFFVVGLVQILAGFRLLPMVGAKRIIFLGVVYVVFALLYGNIGDARFTTLMRVFHIPLLTVFVVVLSAFRLGIALSYKRRNAEQWVGMLVVALLSMVNGVVLVIWIESLAITRIVSSMELVFTGIMALLIASNVLHRKHYRAVEDFDD